MGSSREAADFLEMIPTASQQCPRSKKQIVVVNKKTKFHTAREIHLEFPLKKEVCIQLQDTLLAESLLNDFSHQCTLLLDNLCQEMDTAMVVGLGYFCVFGDPSNNQFIL